MTVGSGEVYGASPSILMGGDAHSAARRVGTIREVVGLPYWTTVGRTTTDHVPGDLPSPVDLSCGLDREGWWSDRFQHSIETRHFGNETLCPFFGSLPKDVRAELLVWYEGLF